jgi:hypothetical protein
MILGVSIHANIIAKKQERTQFNFQAAENSGSGSGGSGGHG